MPFLSVVLVDGFESKGLNLLIIPCSARPGLIARTYLQLPLRQLGAGNVYLLILSSWKVNTAQNPIAVMGLQICLGTTACYMTQRCNTAKLFGTSSVLLNKISVSYGVMFSTGLSSNFSVLSSESDATALSFTEEDFIRHAHCLAWSTLPFILRLSFKPSKPLQRTALPFKVIWNHKAWRTKLETSQILF